MQIALFVAPVFVFASYCFDHPLDLIFTRLVVAAVTMSVLILGFVSMDGESHWMEGVMLVGVYAMLAVAFFFFRLRIDRAHQLLVVRGGARQVSQIRCGRSDLIHIDHFSRVPQIFPFGIRHILFTVG